MARWALSPSGNVYLPWREAVVGRDSAGPGRDSWYFASGAAGVWPGLRRAAWGAWPVGAELLARLAEEATADHPAPLAAGCARRAGDLPGRRHKPGRRIAPR